VTFTFLNDQFDTVMDSFVSVWRKGGSYDAYGIESQAYTLLVSDVPCRYDMLSGKENTKDSSFGVQTYTFYMRPLMVDNPPIALNIHHWLQINTGRNTFMTNPDPLGTMLDLKNIVNVADHHLQIEAQLLEP
jgi:hypothetical protein